MPGVPLVGWSAHWPTFLAWLIACGCLSLGWRRLSTFTPLAAPQPACLLQQLTGDVSREALSDAGRLAAIAELNQRLADVSFELSVAPSLFTALIRISLASGAGLTLMLALLDVAAESPWQRAARLGVCALGGFVGALGLALVGRLANGRATRIREDWDRASRQVGKALGTSLQSAGVSFGARASSARLKTQ